jgi:S1-C subfamily serine protease
MKRILGIITISFTAGLAGAYTYFTYLFSPNYGTQAVAAMQVSDHSAIIEGSSTPNNWSSSDLPAEDFVAASKSSTNSVVYIKNISERRYATSWMDSFFGGGGSNAQQQISSGSGVIFSIDGYIVTNNHVIEDADKIEVIHNKKTYIAELVGTDPSTDLAVLKIVGTNLPAIPIGSSKTLNVGEWVIAVGNPFNLTSTVTAGIVSAKGRDINILQGKFPIESFIQTDAAINPGNSGGALVNRAGELVGVNTAILSRTGSYAGYGFAVPVDIVKKIVRDLIEYGEVQKAFFGADIVDLDQDLVKRFDLNIDPNDLSGVVLSYVQQDGAAASIKLEEGDVIIKLDNEKINSKSEFDEIIGYHTPGDQLTVTYKRNNEVNIKKLTLTNREGTTGILKHEIYSSQLLGADFEAVSKVELDRLGIENGLKVFNIKQGLISNIGIREDFIIIRVNRNEIKSAEKLTDILEKIRGRVLIEGINSRGRYEHFSFYLR